MNARILDFPAPRIPLFRRSGPLRWTAFFILLLISAGLAAVFLGSAGAILRDPGGAAPRDPMTLGR
jgi:hypothetical protein